MYLKLVNREIRASRWPWQKGYNWHGMTNSTAPLNQPRPGEKAAPRFGGGWKYKLGIGIGGSTIKIDLLFGMVTISQPSKCICCNKPILRGQKVGPYGERQGYMKHLKCWEDEVPASYKRHVAILILDGENNEDTVKRLATNNLAEFQSAEHVTHVEDNLKDMQEWLRSRVRSNPEERWLILCQHSIAETSVPPVKFHDL